MTPCCLAVGAGCLALACSVAGAQELAPFRLTDVGGEFSVRYRLDEWRDHGASGTTFVTTPVWEEELSIRTRSYVYHPAFLDMEIGGGPLLVQYGYDSDQGGNSGSDVLFNFDAALNFLDRKAYPFTVYYRRDHPDVTTGLSGRFLATTDEYGIRGVLKPPLSPMFVSWEAGHWDTKGSGFGTTLDEQIDRVMVRTSLAYREGDSLGVSLNWSERTSQSGNPGLPIQSSVIETWTAELDGASRFGDSVSLRQNFFWQEQETKTGAETTERGLAYTGRAGWQNSEATRSFANLRYGDTERTASWSRNADASAGVIHDFTDHLAVSGEGGYAQDRTPGFAQDVATGRLTANYRRELPFGSLGLSGSLGQRRTDQRSDVGEITVFDEPVVLAGTEPVPLAREFVVAASVVVTNVPKTQTFVEGLDYRLVTVGSTTTIERLITGNIADGQTVLVTYDVATGGTVKYDTLSKSAAATLTLYRYFGLFLHFSDRTNDILEGVSTTPLNDVNRVEFGGRADYPLSSGWAVGGEYRHIDQDEDISPYARDSYRVYLRTARYWGTSATLAVSRELADNEASPEDVDQWRYTLGIASRLKYGVVLGYNAEYLEDDGGTVFRKERRQSVQLDWSYRRFRFSLRADDAEIIQGGDRSDDRRVTAEVRRQF